MTQPRQTTPAPATAAVRAVIAARDVRDLQRRVRAFTGTGVLHTAPTSYHR